MITLFNYWHVLGVSVLSFIILAIIITLIMRLLLKDLTLGGSKTVTAAITISIFGSLFIILLVFLSIPPITLSVSPDYLEENLTFSNNTSFIRSETVALHNIGQDLEKINLNLVMPGCNLSIDPNSRNRDYATSGATIYLAFNLTLAPENLSYGSYRGSIQINATPSKSSLDNYLKNALNEITVKEIPLTLKFTK